MGAGSDGPQVSEGRVAGRYVLEALIGQGGMGEVYRARDTVFPDEPVVALKRLKPDLVGDGDYQRRFRREAAAARKLSSPHVLTIYDFVEFDNTFYIVMPMIEGMDLGRLLSESGPLPPARAVDIVAQVADALDSAHEASLIHRDVKPSNVLIKTHHGDDFVYLVDFGVVRAAASVTGASALTAHGAMVGTLAYMAPELFEGSAIDHRVDVYALGCLLFEALTGRPPYPGTAMHELMWAHFHAPSPVVSAHRPGLSPVWDAVVATALAKDPRERYPSAGELARAARAALKHDTPDRRATVHAPGDHPPGAQPGLPGDGGWGVPEQRTAGPDGPPRPSPATHLPPGPGPTPAGSGRRRPVGLLVGGAVLVVAVLIALAAVVAGWRPIGGSSGGPGRSATPSASRPVPLVIPDAAPLYAVEANPTVGESPSGAAVAPDGRHVYVSNGVDGTVSVLDPGTNAVTSTVRVGDSPVAVAVGPDGDRAYVANYDGNSVSVLDLRSMSVAITIPVPGGPNTVALTPDGKRAYVSTFFDNNVVVIDTTSNLVVARVPVDAGPQAVAVAPDGAHAYVTSSGADGLSGNSLSVIDTGGNVVVKKITVGTGPTGVAVSPDGKRAYVAVVGETTAPATLAVVDLVAGSVAAVVPLGTETSDIPAQVAVTPDGGRVIVTQQGTVKVAGATAAVIDTASNRVVAKVGTDPGPRGVAVSPDGQRAYVTNQGLAEKTGHTVSVIHVKAP
jgi:serine/threonine-protein kinase